MTFEGMVVHYNQRWLRFVTASWVTAICFGRHVFTRYPVLTDHALAHEYCHVLQYRRLGVFGYLVRYLYWSIRVGYTNNPFEREARTYADFMVPAQRPGWQGRSLLS